MLILVRKPSETILIGDNITITVLGFNGPDKVRIGIDAPKEITVLRGEVQDRTKIRDGNR